MLSDLKQRIEIGDFEPQLLDSADALGAVLCAFAGVAVSDGKVASPPDPDLSIYEGWIAVHL